MRSPRRPVRTAALGAALLIAVMVAAAAVTAWSVPTPVRTAMLVAAGPLVVIGALASLRDGP